MKSSIIDVPRQAGQDDLFGIQVYQDALVKYVQLTDTPITIALQGEWGSGKTSLMNQLRYNLCDADNAMYYPIWLNTWQYSLMKTPAQAIISILEGIITQIGQLNPSEHRWQESKKKIGGLFKKMASVGTKVAAGAVGIDGGLVDELFSGEDGCSDILQLKNEISHLIEDALKNDAKRVGFTFFIDDLDRIDPPVAVEILELLKNIFDLPHCVFILAIDYDVVIKGLKPKFGELTDKNEREFRSFFDKIIQLPFSMPVASYSIDTFLVDALRKIDFFTEEELNDPTVAETVSEIARLSVGSNPRSLKRLSNTLALISIINEMQTQISEMQNLSMKELNFSLVCMQIAYPYIYNQLTEEPDFKQWNDRIASRLKLRPLTDTEIEALNSVEEFDEEWEKVLFRMCQKETYLSNRTFSVSGLLNKIAVIVNDDANLGGIISATLELSAITNLKAFDGPIKKVYKFNRDLNNYSYKGRKYPQKTKLVNDIVTDYIAAHPGITFEQVCDAFRVTKNMSKKFMPYDVYDQQRREKGKVSFFASFSRKDAIKVADGEFVICSNWPTSSNGEPADFTFFLERCKTLGIEVRAC
ncbi:MAG: P-loop NTPase fold protein [Muribaculaceae bacterium]